MEPNENKQGDYIIPAFYIGSKSMKARLELLKACKPSPLQLAKYCGGLPCEYMEPPQVSYFILKDRTATCEADPDALGRLILAGIAQQMKLFAVTDKGKKKASLIEVEGLYDVLVDGFPVYTYKPEIEHRSYLEELIRKAQATSK